MELITNPEGLAYNICYGAEEKELGTPAECNVVPLGLRAKLLQGIRGRSYSTERSLLSYEPISLFEPNEDSLSMIQNQFDQDRSPLPGSFLTEYRDSVAIVQNDSMVFIEGHGIIWIPRIVDCLGLAAISRPSNPSELCKITAMHITPSSHYGVKHVAELLEPHSGASNLHLFYLGMRIAQSYIHELAQHPNNKIRYDYEPVLNLLRDNRLYERVVRQVLPQVRNPRITTTRKTTRPRDGKRITAEYLALSTTEGRNYWKIFTRREISPKKQGLFPTKEEEVKERRRKRQIKNRKKKKKRRR